MPDNTDALYTKPDGVAREGCAASAKTRKPNVGKFRSARKS